MEDSSAFGGCCLSILVLTVSLLIFSYVPRYLDEKRRKEKIIEGAWDAPLKELAIQKKLQIGMDENLTFLSWGKPSSVDSVEITTEGKNCRWVYGEKNKNAKYVYFTKGRISKIFLS